MWWRSRCMRNEASRKTGARLEAAKSGALAVLVALSVLLTLQVWGGADAGRGVRDAGRPDADASVPDGNRGATRRVAAAELIPPAELVFGVEADDKGGAAGAGPSSGGRLAWAGCGYGTEAYDALWGSEGLLAGSRLGEGLPPAAVEAFLAHPPAEPWRLVGAISIAVPAGVDAETFLRAWGVDVPQEAASLLKDLPETAGGSAGSGPKTPAGGGGWRIVAALARGSKEEEARWYLAALGPAGEARGGFRLEGAGPGRAGAALQKVKAQLGRPAEAASAGLVSYAFLFPGELAPGVCLTTRSWVSEDPFGSGGRFAVEAARPDLSLVVDSFFFDRSLVRTIEELDGAIICTDGRRGLRVYPTGVVEYTVARGYGQRDTGQADAKTAERGLLSAALEAAGAFIGDHGGWPDGASLSSVTAYGTGWKMEFGWHYRGCRVELPVPAMSVVLSEAEVLGYNRLILRVAQPAREGRADRKSYGGGPMGVLAAARKSFSRLPQTKETKIVAIRPVWLVPEVPRPDRPVDAIPAWMFLKEDGEAIYIDAVTGDAWRSSSGRFESEGPRNPLSEKA